MAKIDKLFDELLSRRGSDLHLAVGYPPIVRARGDLIPIREHAVDAPEIEALLFEILNDGQRERITTELDLDFAHAYGKKARFRANYFYKQSPASDAGRDAASLGAVFRTIPTDIQTLEQLCCPDAVRKLADRRAGLVLVTGPTGSGKSTTLAGMIRHINATRACHILTIEDPVEFVHTPDKAQVTHREVGVHASSFAFAIRSAGREDPNVVLIGELRGPETMKLALQLASFGVLVFATVHTNSAPATIDRILNSFPAEEQPQVRGLLAESLAGVVAQQLLKSADGKGRVAAQEILIGTSGIAAMIREGKTFQIPSAMQNGLAIGMQTMDMALEQLVKQRRISIDVALERASDRETLERKLRPGAGG
jgi:twitching motility protein PilT